ncbi:sigma-54 dependent transcription regulator [Myxococcus stipitatus DSM 14675]|uniref:Sigma-54 dependent transcription regulator n=1 Tax=Myxococcus stipitatus (strain DSM 14675 / JCM 12634 / Mx s8) TaxID=1278073 RepID=L7UK32_MYXSD|nr:sigma-54-dependent Fis family transcriptional regulator [Myxococcus stipitatus]AGC46814.1 sigma-54 dependent transcription regulator [Myxococcus stipitatus DSM 14675]
MGTLTLSASAHLWEQFLVGALDGEQATIPEVPPILSRWQRSRALGAPCTGLPHEGPSVGSAALVERRERLEPVWHEVRDILDVLAAAPLPSGRVALLADREGVILATRSSGGSFGGHADDVRLVAGACWDEVSRGTNAIGTALVESSAVAVVGPAHYAQRHHGLVCYAAPVRDAFGELVGVLDVTGPASGADPLVLVAVASIAHSAEARLREVAWARVASAVRGRLEARLAREDGPVLLIEAPGRVRRLNGAARTVMSLSQGSPGELSSGRVLGLSWADLKDAALRGHSLEACQPSTGARWRVQVEAVGEGDVTLAVLVRLEPRLTRAVAKRLPVAEDAGPEGSAWEALKGSDSQHRAMLKEAARFAPTMLPVLLLSETGTGKELLARAVHAASSVASGPFVAVNCGALSSALLESELFGHAPGAFTGARAGGAEGKLAAADGGTLFLDELAEMPAALQVLLLRVLEDGGYSRVGESHVRHSRFRLIGATCRDLDAAVRAGTFRGDLYYRLQGVMLRLPPLRERDDLAMLAQELLGQLSLEGGHPASTLSTSALERLKNHGWPGNVRELKTVLRLALVRAGGAREVDVAALPPELGLGPGAVPRAPGGAREDAASATGLRALEAQAVREALERSGGNMARAARRLGVARSTLYRMVERLGLVLPPRA